MFMLIDTKDFIKYSNGSNKENFLNKKDLKEYFKKEKEIPFSSYQTFLTIPSVQVGSENYSILLMVR